MATPCLTAVSLCSLAMARPKSEPLTPLFSKLFVQMHCNHRFTLPTENGVALILKPLTVEC